jgi:2-keto-4-pentenoate hydratase/2-oxohepta-3-ene-1,7-dioic acid hydratase in catechol pathway
MTSLQTRITALLAALALASSASASTELARCLEEARLPRVVRVMDGESGSPVYARVVAQSKGAPTSVSPIGDGAMPLGDALDRAARPPDADAPVWSMDEESARICAPVPLTQREIDAETHVITAAGLNYAAHAEEAGGGDVFLFPKPVEPGAPYGAVSPPEGVTLLDYEVELAFVLLEDLDLRALPSPESLLARTAFFVANDVTDREPIIVHKAFSGPGTGFVEAKGQPSFLPSGPWLVRGTELFAALATCGGEGLGLRLDVDEGDGFQSRQDDSTAAMVLDPYALLARIAEEVESVGFRTPMPVERGGEVRHYPLAIEGADGQLRLPAGSVILTGTPEGVTLQAPDLLGVVGRGLLNLRGPLEQFRHEQLEWAASGEPGGYLTAGDSVRARIDGLGTQIFRISEPGSPVAPDPCGVHQEAPTHEP